ncbi:CIR protein, partial [Plasmodium chabaudi adami]
MFQSLYGQLPDDDDDFNQTDNKNLLYVTYCPKNGDEYQKCNTDYERISAGFGYLLGQLFDNVDSEEDHGDQKGNYVYYGLLWISYKLQQSNKKNNKSIGLYEFFNNHIANGEWYDVIEEYVRPKMSLLNKDVNIDHMIKIYYILKDMCKIFSNDADNVDDFDFMSYYESVKSCGKNIFKKNNNSSDTDNDTSDSSCIALYDMLEHVYNDFKKDYIDKMNLPNDVLPDLPKIDEIKVTLESDLQENTNGTPESQDDGPQNPDYVENGEQIIPENELDQPQNNNTIEENFKPDLSTFEIKLANFETELPHFEIELAKFEPELPNVLDGIEVPDIEIGPQIFLDGLEVSDIEVEYPDTQDYFFDIDTDLSFFEDKYSDLENDPKSIVDALFVSENDPQNIIDELYVSENELSYPIVKPQIIEFDFPDLNIEQTDLDIERNDSDNQSHPHQINTLIFDNPFENPENFSDNIMCKLHGPKSVYCNRIICNRIKIGVIALS